MERSVVHMDLDTFFVSCERRMNTQLIDKPLIIGGASDRAIVASCSVETRKYGVRTGMPMRQAKYLCPDAKVISPDMDYYTKCSSEVAQILEESAPIMERCTISEFYLDVSGMDKFYGCFKWTSELTNKIVKETDLPISFGMSVNKTVSRIATFEAKPHGKINILPDQVKQFINPLSIRKIPGLGNEKYEELARSSIHIIHQLAQIDVAILRKMYGKEGVQIWNKANGHDNAPVEAYQESKSVSKSLTFDNDTIDVNKVKTLLTAFVEKLGHELRAGGWLASVVTVKIRYANLDTSPKQKRIPYTALDKTLIYVVKEQFDKLYDRRMRIRLVSVSFGGLIHGSYQINLFENTQEELDLLHAMDKLRNRFGFKAVMTAQTLGWYQQIVK